MSHKAIEFRRDIKYVFQRKDYNFIHIRKGIFNISTSFTNSKNFEFPQA